MEIKKALVQVMSGVDLTQEHAQALMEQVMEGKVTPAQLAGLITALKMKGEAVSEIAGFARAMRAKASPIQVQVTGMVDTCGTGGDGSSTFNISTATALVVAAAGIPVAKHGNRSVSSKCGSADVLEQLGVKLDLEPQEVGACVDQIGIGFLFAPVFHPAMKHAVGPRKELGFRSIFNLLGPLTNPLGAKRQVLGVYQPQLTESMGQVLKELGSQRAFIVHGSDGLDEITITGPTKITELNTGKLSTYQFHPGEVGLATHPIEALAGNTPKENALIITQILSGVPGARRDVVLLNAAFALVAGGVVTTVEAGVALARETIDTGKAQAKLEQLIKYTKKEVA